jgi:hypothetical protein
LDQARLTPAGDGAALLCRLLVEVIAADPLASPCAAEDVPLRAEYHWPQGAGIVFEVAAWADRPALTAAQLLTPPQSARFVTGELPATNGPLLSQEQLASLRIRAVDPGSLPLTAPSNGILAQNGTDVARLLFVDSVPIAAVGAGRTERIEGLLRGRYQVQWRTFLGDTTDPPQIIEVPARVAIGVSDGGAAKP